MAEDQFILRRQTHHVDVGKKWYEDTPEGRKTVRFLQNAPAVRRFV